MVRVLYGSFRTGSFGVRYEVLELAALVRRLRERVGNLSGQAMRVALGDLNLQRIVPGVAHRRSQERRDAEPLRVGPQGLGESLAGGEAGIDVAGICQQGEFRDHGRVADRGVEQGVIGRIREGHI